MSSLHTGKFTRGVSRAKNRVYTRSGLAAFKRPILSNQSVDFDEIKSIVTRIPISILGTNPRIDEPQSFRVNVDICSRVHNITFYDFLGFLSNDRCSLSNARYVTKKKKKKL